MITKEIEKTRLSKKDVVKILGLFDKDFYERFVKNLESIRGEVIDSGDEEPVCVATSESSSLEEIVDNETIDEDRAVEELRRTNDLDRFFSHFED